MFKAACHALLAFTWFPSESTRRTLRAKECETGMAAKEPSTRPQGAISKATEPVKVELERSFMLLLNRLNDVK